MLECRFHYVLQVLAATRRHQTDAIDVRPEVMTAFNGQLQQDMQPTAWVAGCTSRSKTADGRITNNWPGSVEITSTARPASIPTSMR